MRIVGFAGRHPAAVVPRLSSAVDVQTRSPSQRAREMEADSPRLLLLLLVVFGTSVPLTTAVNYTVAFDFVDPLSLPIVYATYTNKLAGFPTGMKGKTFVFENFPRMPLYASTAQLQAGIKKLQDWNTMFTIGSKSYYGLKLTYSKINVTDINSNNLTYMNYMPVFNFPITLHAKIIEKIYAKIRERDNQQIARTMFVLNSTTVNPDRPWENVEILNAMLKEVSGSLRFMYYQNNANDIARKIRDTSVNDVILMVNSDATLKILKAANERGLLKWRYRWLIYQMSISTLNAKNVGFEADSNNITLVQFADASNDTVKCKTPMECVISDSMEIFTVVAKTLFSTSTATEVPIPGKTGDFKFIAGNLKSHEGMNSVTRTSWVMQIIRRLGSKSTIVGNVTGDLDGSNPNITVTLLSTPGEKDLSEAAIRQDLSKNPLRIITVLEPPFVQKAANHTGAFSTVNAADQLEGIVIDVGKAMMKQLNISYTITIDPSGSYGAKQTNGQWSGMILQIMNGKADLALAAFGITNERKVVVDFLVSFMSYKGAVLLKENTEEGISAMFHFLRPFDIKVWGMLIGSMFAIAIVLALLHCISPNKTNYNLYESFFFSIGSVLQGVTTTPPDKPSGRIVVCFWWFFSLIIVITYIANYGAYRTQARIQGVITSLNNLLNQNYYTYGTVQDTAYDSLFRTSTFEYMQKINKMIRQEFKNGLIKDSTKGLELVKKGNYAFIWDNTITRYFAYQHCLKSTAEFDQYYYGFIVPKKADYKALLDKAITELKRDNVISTILSKYPFIESTETNPKCQFVGFLGQIRKYIPKELFKYASPDALTLDQTFGIFAIMIAGCIISLLLALIECSCRICCQKYMDRKSKSQGAVKKKTESYA